MVFILIMSAVIVQRLVELVIAKRNEKWMMRQGAFEVGKAHYPLMVMMHTAFFLSLLLEYVYRGLGFSKLGIYFFILFALTQVARIWCLTSLGKFWNTKIIILPGAEVVSKGPYRWIRHPNYVIVTVELIVLPLMFNATYTAVIFFFLNLWMLSVRIPLEEKALREATNYVEKFNLK